MRKKILAANWKMNLTHSEAGAYLQAFLSEIGDVNDVEVVIIPPFTAIPTLAEAFDKIQSLRLGAQNMHWEKSGAFTGEISAQMLKALYVKYVVIGHSERRTLFGETDELVNRKVRSAFDAGLRPIVCVGETRQQRDQGQTLDICRGQLTTSLPDGARADNLVVAYEPVWAIGTGLTPTLQDIEQIHRFIRDFLMARFKEEGGRIRILYGGSVKPSNAAELMAVANVNGALIGGASLKAADFLAIAAGCP